MDVKQYLDSTYLKTPGQAGLTEAAAAAVVQKTVQEAIAQNFKLVMIRPDKVLMAREAIDAAKSTVLVGTVIDFPLGNGGLAAKLAEAGQAIANGADELDFVANYNAYIAGNGQKVMDEIKGCTQLALQNNKVAKWIIETAALTDLQIVSICSDIQKMITDTFDKPDLRKIFIKSSTGFYKTPEAIPNGATPHTIQLMLDNSGPLPVKAAGGVRNYDEAVTMLQMGVQRIGTSSAKAIADGYQASGRY